MAITTMLKISMNVSQQLKKTQFLFNTKGLYYGRVWALTDFWQCLILITRPLFFVGIST